MNINKLKKIGATALAGSLVSFAATAAEFSVSGGASITMDNTAESKSTTFAQGDSLKFNASGETDGGLNIKAYFEMDGDDSGFDDRYISFGNDAMGTVQFWGHGGSSVMSMMDDISPKAYEEITDVTTSADADAVAADTVIGGVGEDNMFVYTSPSFSGLTLQAAMNTASSTTVLNKYSDIGVTFAPEMVEGLTLYYAAGTQENTANTDTDVSTMAVKYAYGPITVSYQESESDISGSTDDDEVEQFGISYTVSDELSISYGTRERDYNTASNTGDGNLTQEDAGFGIAYTMGGVAIKAQSNSSDNIAGGNTTNDDTESTSVSVSFAF